MFGTSSEICSRKQSISVGAMTALCISKSQEFYNRERRRWRGADDVFYIAVEMEKLTSICYNKKNIQMIR